MATTITTDVSKFMLAGMDKFFTENFKSWANEYTQWTKVRGFDKLVNYLQNVGNLPMADEMLENTPVSYTSLNETVQTSLTLKQLGIGLAFSLQAAKGDLYGIVDESKLQEVMRSLKYKMEKIAIKPWDDAFDVVQSDGVAMCSIVKPCLDSAATYYTKLTSGGVIGSAGGSNIKSAIQYMAQQKNAQGDPFVAIADTIGTHAANQMDVEALFGSADSPFQTSTGTGLQTKNTIPKLRPVYSHFLTETDYWYVWDSSIDHVVSGFLNSMATPSVKGEEDLDTRALKTNVVYLFGAASLPNPGLVGSSGA